MTLIPKKMRCPRDYPFVCRYCKQKTRVGYDFKFGRADGEVIGEVCCEECRRHLHYCQWEDKRKESGICGREYRRKIGGGDYCPFHQLKSEVERVGYTAAVHAIA